MQSLYFHTLWPLGMIKRGKKNLLSAYVCNRQKEAWKTKFGMKTYANFPQIQIFEWQNTLFKNKLIKFIAHMEFIK